MNYLADTVALVRHMRGCNRLGAQANHIFQQADAGGLTIFIAGVSLMEILYLSEKRRIPINLADIQTLLSGSQNYQVIPVGLEAVVMAASVDDVPELHDRLILATAKLLEVPIITNDPVMVASKHVKTVWK